MFFAKVQQFSELVYITIIQLVYITIIQLAYITIIIF